MKLKKYKVKVMTISRVIDEFTFEAINKKGVKKFNREKFREYRKKGYQIAIFEEE